MSWHGYDGCRHTCPTCTHGYDGCRHTCPTCTPELWVDRHPICPRCGVDMPGAKHHDKWAYDLCDRCERVVAEQLGARRAEVEHLRAWKVEALADLAEWERVWEAAGQPGPLGGSKAENVRRLFEDEPAPPSSDEILGFIAEWKERRERDQAVLDAVEQCLVVFDAFPDEYPTSKAQLVALGDLIAAGRARREGGQT